MASCGMILRRLVARFLAISVIAGLILAPLVTPAAVKASEVGGMSSMSADMPCCPDEQKSKDCQDCPLVAICVLKTAQPGPSPTQVLPLRYAIRTVHPFIDDAPADGLVRPPPEHPPRT
jgi:hypothetical protein